MSSPLLQVTDLDVDAVDDPGNSILRGLDFTVSAGELHAIIGPNGSGKSTLGRTLLGSPTCRVTGGSITFDGDDITAWPTAERAKLGMFVGFQHPVAFPGVTVGDLLRHALATRPHIDLSVPEIRSLATEWMIRLGLGPSFVDRYVNEGFSAGETRRSEIVQMAVLDPTFAFLDDVDAGLDPAGFDIVARGLDEIRSRRPEIGLAVVTTSRRFLRAVAPTTVHMMIAGRIVAEGGAELAEELQTTNDASQAFA